MRILAIETTEAIGTVAAASDSNVLAQLELNPTQRTAQSLAPGIRQLLAEARWQPADVQLVAVSIGPGSFTGLRVGVTVAKVFAYAVGAEVLGVDTLETIAAAAPDHVSSLAVAVDAQRGEVVARSFDRGHEGWFEPAGPEELLPIDVWLGRLAQGATVSGPVLRKLSERIPGHVTVLDAAYRSPAAANVARLAARHYAAGQRDDLWKLVPRYSRRSAAEEKWEKR